MPRIVAPTIETAPAASQPQLAAVKKQLGVVPNLFRTEAGRTRIGQAADGSGRASKSKQDQESPHETAPSTIHS